MTNYMKIKKTRKNKLIITSVIIIAIIISAGCGYWYWQTYLKIDQSPISNGQTTDQTVNYSSPTTDQKQAGEDQKITNQTPVSITVSTTITAKNVTADTLQIRSMTSGAISNDGTCNLTLTNGIAVISKTAATYAMPSSSTCQGFDIARTELSNGTWQINLDVIIDGEKSSATGEVTLE